MNSTSDGSMPLQISVSPDELKRVFANSLRVVREVCRKRHRASGRVQLGMRGRTALSLTISIVRDSIWKTANSMPSLKKSTIAFPQCCSMSDRLDEFIPLFKGPARLSKRHNVHIQHFDLQFHIRAGRAHAHCFRVLSVLVETEFSRQVRSTLSAALLVLWQRT